MPQNVIANSTEPAFMTMPQHPTDSTTAADVFGAFAYEENELAKRPRFDELMNQLAAHAGLFSRTTFHNIFGSLIRMVRDHNLEGVVILRTQNDETFDMLSMPLHNMMKLDVFKLDHAEIPEQLSSPNVGFIILLTNRLSASLHWNSETSQAFRMDQGGWSFNPGDVHSLALHLAEWLGHDPMEAAIKKAPIDRRYDDKLSLIVSSLLSNLENRNRELTLALEREKALSKRIVDNERMVAIGELSSVIAHEIRNPLGLIALYAELVQGQLGKLSSDTDIPPMLFKNLDQIKDATQHLETILSELTQYSRPLELYREPLDMRRFVQDVCDFYKPKYDEKGVTLEVEMQLNLRDNEPATFALSADSGRMRQGLINLLKNALEATDSGRKVIASLSCRRDDDYVYIKVRDEGTGVPADKQCKLFTPYFSTKSAGTGLGLAFVLKVMKAHSGTAKLLWSEQGKGSTFALMLPRHPIIIEAL